jgi:hypothetical protein
MPRHDEGVRPDRARPRLRRVTTATLSRATLTIALAIGSLAWPAAAFANTDPPSPRPSEVPAVQASAPQELRSPDARDAARADQPQDWRTPDTRSAAAAHSNRAKDPGDRAAPGDDVDRALAQERYYASYGKPTPLTKAAPAVAPNTGDGIVSLPFVVAVLGALVIGLGAGSGLHLLYARRRHATGLVT